MAGEHLLHHPTLLAYLFKRGISLETAIEHCREIHYHRGGKSYFSIGFQNDGGGWELRNPSFKSCIAPKGITTVDRGSDDCLVFEGFMDYLSYLSLERKVRPDQSAVVLNSVVNIRKAIPFLERHKTVLAYLDNDDSGRKALAEMKAALPGCRAVDRSGLYAEHKDQNEYLRQAGKEQNRTTQKPLCPCR